MRPAALLFASKVCLTDSPQQHQHQTAAALETTRPHIEQTLAEDLAALEQLDVHLPRVEEELVCIGHVYDCGRVKVCPSAQSRSTIPLQLVRAP